jgi:hypothetical protein
VDLFAAAVSACARCVCSHCCPPRADNAADQWPHQAWMRRKAKHVWSVEEWEGRKHRSAHAYSCLSSPFLYTNSQCGILEADSGSVRAFVHQQLKPPSDRGPQRRPSVIVSVGLRRCRCISSPVSNLLSRAERCRRVPTRAARRTWALTTRSAARTRRCRARRWARRPRDPRRWFATAFRDRAWSWTCRRPAGRRPSERGACGGGRTCSARCGCVVCFQPPCLPSAECAVKAD